MSVSGDPLNPEGFFGTPIVFVVFLRMITVDEFIHFSLSSQFFLLRSRMLGLTYPIMNFPRPVSVMFVVFTVSRAAAHSMSPVVLLL